MTNKRIRREVFTIDSSINPKWKDFVNNHSEDIVSINELKYRPYPNGLLTTEIVVFYWAYESKFE